MTSLPLPPIVPPNVPAALVSVSVWPPQVHHASAGQRHDGGAGRRAGDVKHAIGGHAGGVGDAAGAGQPKRRARIDLGSAEIGVIGGQHERSAADLQPGRRAGSAGAIERRRYRARNRDLSGRRELHGGLRRTDPGELLKQECGGRNRCSRWDRNGALERDRRLERRVVAGLSWVLGDLVAEEAADRVVDDVEIVQEVLAGVDECRRAVGGGGDEVYAVIRRVVELLG